MAIDTINFNSDTNVRYIDNFMYGTPDLINSRGSLLNLLKVILSEGFNLKTVLNISKESEDILLITLPTSHGFLINQVIELSGATDSNLNGNYRILYSDSTTIKIKHNKVLNDLTGTLNIKVASLGYKIVYNDNKGTICFQNSSTKSPAILKVIDTLPPNGYLDSWAKFARVAAGQQIDSNGKFVNNEKTPFHKDFPLGEETGNGVSGAPGIHSTCRWDYVLRQYNSTDNGYNDNNTSYPVGIYPTNWRIIGDSNTFYLFVQPMGKDYSGYAIYSFGLYKSNNPNETYNIYLIGNDGWIASNTTGPYQTGAAKRNSFTYSGNDSGGFGLFLFKNIYGSTQHWFRFTPVTLYFYETNRMFPFKSALNNINPINGNLISSPYYIRDINNDFRGELRGIKQLYGSGQMQNNLILENYNSIILQTKLFEWSTVSGNSEQVPYLFSFKNWEL